MFDFDPCLSLVDTRFVLLFLEYWLLDGFYYSEVLLLKKHEQSEFIVAFACFRVLGMKSLTSPLHHNNEVLGGTGRLA
jgi:hypothetical protein